MARFLKIVPTDSSPGRLAAGTLPVGVAAWLIPISTGLLLREEG